MNILFSFFFVLLFPKAEERFLLLLLGRGRGLLAEEGLLLGRLGRGGRFLAAEEGLLLGSLGRGGRFLAEEATAATLRRSLGLVVGDQLVLGFHLLEVILLGHVGSDGKGHATSVNARVHTYGG